MTFTYPLGLIGLVGIPVLIIIYILRSKYNEQTVPSTYLWTLSDKFLKRKNPLSGLTGLISLILQILTVAFVSLAIAHPVFTLPAAANDYVFVLDNSGSMNMKEGKGTRFDAARAEIRDIIEKSADGSSYTLALVSDRTVKVMEEVSGKESALRVIETLEPGYKNTEREEVTSAAQAYFDSNPSALVYLLTDKAYGEYSNIEVINVAKNPENNCSVTDVEYTHAGGKLTVTATVTSFMEDAELTLGLYIDGAEAPASEVKASCIAAEPTELTLECPSLRFSSFRVALTEGDGYTADDGVTVYNLESDKTYSTLIVSENGFFFEAVIDALLDAEVEVVTPAEYEAGQWSYGLYIFDSYSPPTLPDGAVWLVNSSTSIPMSGFGVRGKVSVGEPEAITKSSSTATTVRELLRDVDGSDIFIKNYVKYSGMYLSFSTLFTYDSNPVIFAGANGLGNRQVVIGFDIHESDFALSTDFVLLISNLLEYSFPNIIGKTLFTVGETAAVNITAGAENIKAVSPSGKEVFMDSDGVMAALPLDEVGTYTVSLTVRGDRSSYKLYSVAHPEESLPEAQEAGIHLSGEKQYERRNGSYDPTAVLFVLIILLFMADWGIYCYEKYQLR